MISMNIGNKPSTLWLISDQLNSMEPSRSRLSLQTTAGEERDWKCCTRKIWIFLMSARVAQNTGIPALRSSWP